MKKRLLITAVVALIIALAAALAVFFAYFNIESSGVKEISPHYLSYGGSTTKIYLSAATTSYGNVNESYVMRAGQVVQKGSPLFIVTVTLRNDYSSDSPPPPLPNEPPTSPTDGTAYVYLTAQLYNKTSAINATNVSVSDFSLPFSPGTGLVLASGQTGAVNIYMATTQTDINKCNVNLIFVGDSIPP